MLPFSGGLDLQCTISHAVSPSTSWKWRSALTEPATTRVLGSGDASITTETVSECNRKSRLIVPDFVNSEFEYGAMICEVDGKTKGIVIEKGGTVRSLSSWFDVQGTQLRLACTVTGIPRPQIQWMFGNDSNIVASPKYTVGVWLFMLCSNKGSFLGPY